MDSLLGEVNNLALFIYIQFHISRTETIGISTKELLIYLWPLEINIKIGIIVEKE